jgi:putative nucleotidyltransferase with HDIG domain
METGQVEKLKVWFTDYVAGFYGDDDFVNANLKLKEDHSRRVCQQMRYLADAIGLVTNQKMLAEVIAILHDIGRFQQFSQYRTYKDIDSVDHVKLSIEIINQTGILADFEAGENRLIKKAIEYHGVRELPAGLNGELLVFAQLIRDADKLDVYYLMSQCYKAGKDDKFYSQLEQEYPDLPEISTEVLNDILNERRIDYKILRTLNDFKIMQLGWVYDINFKATFERIKQFKLLEGLARYLPAGPDSEKIKNKIFRYVDLRLA